MIAKVVDASVLGAVVFNEPRLAEAVALLRDADLLAPTLLAYELGSIARKKILLYPAITAELSASLEDALAMDIGCVEVDQRAVVELALESGLTTYDASYLHLARSHNVPLVTFDQQLLSAVAGAS